MSRPAPERMCVVCRTLKPRDKLLRCVKQKGSQKILLDFEGKMSGKGVYFCRQVDCLERLRRERRLRRLFLDRMTDTALDEMKAELVSE